MTTYDVKCSFIDVLQAEEIKVKLQTGNKIRFRRKI